MALPMMGSLDGPGATGPSYAVVLVPAHDRAQPAAVLAELERLRFTGWVSPQSGRWCVVVPEHPLGHVAAGRLRVVELAGALAVTPGPAAICLEVQREELLQITAFDGEQRVLAYLSDAHVARPRDEFAYGAEGAHGAPQLVRLSAAEVDDDDVLELLSEEYGEDENESERLTALARMLDWPDWLVAVIGLPKRVAGGPAPETFTRLRAGRTGIAGRLADRAAGVVRRKDVTS